MKFPGYVIALSVILSIGGTLGTYQMLPFMQIEPKTGLLLLGVFLVFILLHLLLFRFVFKKISISAQKLTVLTGISIVLATILTFLFHLSLPQKEIVLPVHTIQIQAVPVNSNVEKRNIQFLSLNNGYRGLAFSDFVTNGQWERQEDQLILSDLQQGDSLTFTGKTGRDVQLFFMVGPEAGKIKIDWGDGSEEVVDLQRPETEQTESQLISHQYGASARRLEILNFIVNLFSVISLLFLAIFLYLILIFAALKNKTKTFKILFAVLTFSTIMIRTTNVYNFPLGWDEGTYSRAAMRYAEKALAFRWEEIPAETYNYEHPALVKLTFAIPVIMDGRSSFDRFGLSGFNNSDLAKEDYTIFTGRIVSAIFSLFTVQALAILINPIAGFLFMIHSLAEEFGAQARLEAMPMLFSFLSVWIFDRYLKLLAQGQRKGRRKWLILSAFFLGLTAASKVIYSVVVFAILIAAIDQVIRDRSLLKPVLLSLIAYAPIALIVFYLFNPTMWNDPLRHISMMLGFHNNYQIEAGEIYPWWQPLIWMTRSVAHHPETYFTKSSLGKSPEHFFFSADELIFLLACLGAGTLYKKDRIYLFWFAFGLIFLFLWGTKWVHYACILTVPICISASIGLKKAAAFIHQKM